MTITAVRDIVSGGNTRLYFSADDGQVYRLDDPTDAAILLAAGDRVTFTYRESGTSGVRLITAFTRAE